MKNKVYTETECNWRYNSSCAADTDCLQECKMPCPSDKEQSPCDMCNIECNEDNKANCIALKVYKNKRI